MNLAQKIAKESTITFSGMVYGNINRYLYIALLARWVGVEYLGIYSLANAIMLIGEVIAKMGLETGIMRFISRMEPETEKFQIQKIIQSSLLITGIFSIGIAIMLAGFSWVLVNFFKGTPLLHSAIRLSSSDNIQLSVFVRFVESTKGKLDKNLDTFHSLLRNFFVDSIFCSEHLKS